MAPNCNCNKINFFAAVILFFYIAIHNQAEIFDSEDGEILQLDDKSRFIDFHSTRKELIKMKTEVMNFEKSLQKMVNFINSNGSVQSNLSMADFASESVGGFVIDTPDTEPFSKVASTQLTIFGIPIWKHTFYSPRKIIQPWRQAGECWSFKGSHGKINIQLAMSINIDKVTMEHIPISASLTGKIDSAPKTFNILGEIGGKYVMIDTFMYDKNGLPSQTFILKHSEMKKIPFLRIILEIVSNWGNSEHTCIYRFKVHGKFSETNN
uniref:SUN domain-containing protein n=1 Tax=Trichogramma kaykai TaxID=54128 RepID=A0ABD2W886_9HYME